MARFAAFALIGLVAACGSSTASTRAATATSTEIAEEHSQRLRVAAVPGAPIFTNRGFAVARDPSDRLLALFDGYRAVVSTQGVELAEERLAGDAVAVDEMCDATWIFYADALYTSPSYLGDVTLRASYRDVRFAAVRGGTLHVSTDRGYFTAPCADIDHPTQVRVGATHELDISDYAETRSLRAAVLQGGALMTSVDDGAHWQRLHIPHSFVFELRIDEGERVHASTPEGVREIRLERGGRVILGPPTAAGDARDLRASTEEDDAFKAALAERMPTPDTFFGNGRRIERLETDSAEPQPLSLVLVEPDGRRIPLAIAPHMTRYTLHQFGTRTVLHVGGVSADEALFAYFVIGERGTLQALPFGLSATDRLIVFDPAGRYALALPRTPSGDDPLDDAHASLGGACQRIEDVCVLDFTERRAEPISIPGGTEVYYADLVRTRILLQEVSDDGRRFLLANATTPNSAPVPLPSAFNAMQNVWLAPDGTLIGQGLMSESSGDEEPDVDRRKLVLAEAGSTSIRSIELPSTAGGVAYLDSLHGAALDADRETVWVTSTGGASWTRESLGRAATVIDEGPESVVVPNCRGSLCQLPLTEDVWIAWDDDNTPLAAAQARAFRKAPLPHEDAESIAFPILDARCVEGTATLRSTQSQNPGRVLVQQSGWSAIDEEAANRVRATWLGLDEHGYYDVATPWIEASRENPGARLLRSTVNGPCWFSAVSRSGALLDCQGPLLFVAANGTATIVNESVSRAINTSWAMHDGQLVSHSTTDDGRVLFHLLDDRQTLQRFAPSSMDSREFAFHRGLPAQLSFVWTGEANTNKLIVVDVDRDEVAEPTTLAWNPNIGLCTDPSERAALHLSDVVSGVSRSSFNFYAMQVDGIDGVDGAEVRADLELHGDTFCVRSVYGRDWFVAATSATQMAGGRVRPDLAPSRGLVVVDTPVSCSVTRRTAQ